MNAAHREQAVYTHETLHGVDRIIAFHSNLETARRHEHPTLSRDLSFVFVLPTFVDTVPQAISNHPSQQKIGTAMIETH